MNRIQVLDKEKYIKDISVVVQGAVSECTSNTLASIRKHLPDAYIILSTWEGTDISKLDYDEVVLNRDPGVIAPMHPVNIVGYKDNNINRQIVSTKNGLKRVRTKYALKIRTDFEIKNSNFLNYFEQFPSRIDDYKVFSHRLLSVLGDRPEDRPFFPYDFLFFGCSCDLKLLFNIPLMKKDEAEWFVNHFPSDQKRYNRIKGLFRYIPEQHIWMSCLSKKYPKIWNTMQDYSDVSLDNISIGRLSLINNFVCLELDQFGIYPMKASLDWLYRGERVNVFHFSDWEIEYKRYCDHSYHLSINFIKIFNLDKILLKFNQHKQSYFHSNRAYQKSLYLFKIFLDLIKIICSSLLHIPHLVYFFLKQ